MGEPAGPIQILQALADLGRRGVEAVPPIPIPKVAPLGPFTGAGNEPQYLQALVGALVPQTAAEVGLAIVPFGQAASKVIPKTALGRAALKDFGRFYREFEKMGDVDVQSLDLIRHEVAPKAIFQPSTKKVFTAVDPREHHADVMFRNKLKQGDRVAGYVHNGKFLPDLSRSVEYGKLFPDEIWKESKDLDDTLNQLYSALLGPDF